MLQNLLVALLVATCFGYSLWTLGPKALRNRLAAKLLTLSCPSWMQKRLQAALRQQGGCGSCGGCDGKVATQSSKGTGDRGSMQCSDVAGVATVVRPLVFHPRVRLVLGAKHERDQ